MTRSRPDVLRVYVGVDPREMLAYEVLAKSLRRHASGPVDIIPLASNPLRRLGVYRRAPDPGTWTDSLDGRPFSTDFAFTRFLVPALNLWRGWALFVDCDFLFTTDVFRIFDAVTATAPVHVVKHAPYKVAQAVKMDGREQQAYPFKNWSSLMLFDCAHPDNLTLTPDVVSTWPGRDLHGFKWVSDDSVIGSLPREWNHLVKEYPKPSIIPAAIHFTYGCPWFPGHEYDDFADLWRQELNR